MPKDIVLNKKYDKYISNYVYLLEEESVHSTASRSRGKKKYTYTSARTASSALTSLSSVRKTQRQYAGVFGCHKNHMHPLPDPPYSAFQGADR